MNKLQLIIVDKDGKIEDQFNPNGSIGKYCWYF